MRKHIFAVCDMEVTYAYNFMEYVSQKKNIPFQVQAFTNIENLSKFTKEKKIEILLISQKAMCEEVQKLGIGKIIILSESDYQQEIHGFPSVYKYQSSDCVIREVMSYYTEEEKVAKLDPMTKGKNKLIGVYSPLGRTLKTSFSLVMGQILAKKFGTLYINLEEYSGFEELFNIKYEHNLSDLLFYLNEKQEHVIYKLSGMIHSLNQLDYIPPCLSPVDIQHTTYEQWNQLLDVIQCHSKYQVIIIDFGDGVMDLFNLMERCDFIYMPILEDGISKSKIKQFENLLRMWDCIPVLDKLKKLKLPFGKNDANGRSFLEKLLWSDLGEYTRKILTEDQLI